MKKNAKSLLDVEYPPGFDESGKRVVESCEEFTLYEEFCGGELKERVVYSEKVEYGLMRSKLRVIDRDRESGISSQEERTAISIVLLRMLRSAQRDDGIGCLVDSRAIGKLLDTKSPDDAASILKTCIRGIHAFDRRREDGRTKGQTPLVEVLIYEAHGQFAYHRKPPTKKHLIKRLQAVGYDFPVKKRAEGWRGAFDAAGLGGLPNE